MAWNIGLPVALMLFRMPNSACDLSETGVLVRMNSSNACAFPSGTRYFSLDGTLFAHTEGDEWYTVGPNGTLLKLDANDAPSNPRCVFMGDRIREPEFLAALGNPTLQSVS